MLLRLPTLRVSASFLPHGCGYSVGECGILPLKCGLSSVTIRVSLPSGCGPFGQTGSDFLPRGCGLFDVDILAHGFGPVVEEMQASFRSDAVLPQRCGLPYRVDRINLPGMIWDTWKSELVIDNYFVLPPFPVIAILRLGQSTFLWPSCPHPKRPSPFNWPGAFPAACSQHHHHFAVTDTERFALISLGGVADSSRHRLNLFEGESVASTNRKLYIAVAAARDRAENCILVCTSKDRLSMALYLLPKVIRFVK